jgi:hypothetical protein
MFHRLSPKSFAALSLMAGLMKITVRSTLECGGSTPLWHNAEVEDQGGVEPPHSKVLRT